MKTALYVATVARTYRRAIDDYFESEEKYRSNIEWYKDEIAKCTYRHFSTGFFFGKPSEENQVYDSNTYINEYVYLGTVEKAEGNKAFIEQKNKFLKGDVIEIMKPDGRNVPVKVLSIKDEDGNEMESCPHSRQKLCITLSEPADQNDILRVKNNF